LFPDILLVLFVPDNLIFQLENASVKC
jgi:hypothetical protein